MNVEVLTGGRPIGGTPHCCSKFLFKISCGLWYWFWSPKYTNLYLGLMGVPGIFFLGGRGNEVKVAVLCTWPEMYFWSVLNNCWYFKHQSLTRICSEACLKHNWRFVFKKSKKLQFKKTISSIMFQICFWANPSQDLVFEISKIIHPFDYK